MIFKGGKVIVGVDPGLKGGLAMVNVTTGQVVKADVMPTIQGGKEMDLQALRRWFLHPDGTPAWEWIAAIWLEKVGAMRKGEDAPPQSPRAAFKFGRGVGAIEMLAACLEVRLESVAPGVWQRAMHAGARGDMPKQRSVEAGLRLFPATDFRSSDRATLPHIGKVEAVLIAEYGRRCWTSQPGPV